MKLTIRNFAKIKSAEVLLDGMTVICGDNNTGKSTIGKVLATFIESFVDLQKKVISDRKEKYKNLLSSRTHLASSKKASFHLAVVLNKLLQHSLQDEELAVTVGNILNEAPDSENSQSVLKRIKEVLAIPDSQLERQHVYGCFSFYFDSQLMPLHRANSGNTELVLDLQNQKIVLSFPQDVDSLPVVMGGFDIQHHAYFIDTPDVLEAMADYGSKASKSKRDLNSIVVKAMRAFLNDKRTSVGNSVDDYLVATKIKGIYGKIALALNGDFVSESGKLTFHEDDMPGSLEISNLSKGMKAFALLQLLLKRHVLKEEDVLILDEPEIHLHPAWQVLYAEILVLLQKAFRLKVLLTTHSSYFLEAVQLFCRKHHQQDSLHVYQSVIQQDGMANIMESDANVSDIYGSFMEPLRSLQDLRNELKEEEEGHD